MNHFLLYFQDKVEFLSSLNGKVSKNNILLLKDLKVQFCTKDEMCIGPSEYSLPVICNDFPAIFNEEVYLKVSIIHKVQFLLMKHCTR